MRLFDAHTHLDLKQYQHDLSQVLRRAKDTGVEGMVTSSIGPGSFRRTLGIVKKYKDFVFHSAGCSVSQLTRNEADKIMSLALKHAFELVAIGEVGLDYYWIKNPAQRKAQTPLFLDFIQLAESLRLPIVIHSRNAEAEAVTILEKNFSGAVLMHCFGGDEEVAKRIHENGWYISLPANFIRSKKRIKAATIIPLEQIVLETDGPYLSPTNERNEPANLRFGCVALSDLLELDPSYVAEETTKNARRFYRL